MQHKARDASWICTTGQGRSIAASASLRKGRAFRQPDPTEQMSWHGNGTLRVLWTDSAPCETATVGIRSRADPVSESRKGDRAGCGWPDKKPATCGSRVDRKTNDATVGSEGHVRLKLDGSVPANMRANQVLGQGITELYQSAQVSPKVMELERWQAIRN